MNYRSPEVVRLTKSRAVLFLAGAVGWPWTMARLFGILPTGLLNLVYDFVARHRYRVFGLRERCLIPNPGDRHRFIDS